MFEGKMRGVVGGRGQSVMYRENWFVSIYGRCQVGEVERKRKFLVNWEKRERRR